MAPASLEDDQWAIFCKFLKGEGLPKKQVSIQFSVSHFYNFLEICLGPVIRTVF